MAKEKNAANVSNIYRLEGRVPVAKAIPFGFQHVLAMLLLRIAIHFRGYIRL